MELYVKLICRATGQVIKAYKHILGIPEKGISFDIWMAKSPREKDKRAPCGGLHLRLKGEDHALFFLKAALALISHLSPLNLAW